MKRKKVKFNEAIALKVFQVLDKAWRKRKGIFKNSILPQERWPAKKELSSLSKKDIANWLFYAALPMRGGLVSEDPFRLFWQLRKNCPEIFEPEIVAKKWSPEEVLKTLNKAGIKYKDKEHAENWCKNSKNLHLYWGNDVRNVFRYGVIEFEEAFRRIDYKKSKIPLFGMRRKIFSLLTIWLQEKSLIPIFPAPIPIDFHALRVLWATEIINLNGWAKPFTPKEKHPEQLAGKVAIRVWESLIDQIMIWSQKFLQKSEISHLIINPALWFLSRSLCAGHFQNSSRKNATKYVETEDLLENPDLWPRNYKNPCAYCPVENWCKWAIPNAPYYRWGILVRIGKRVPYPKLYLPGMESPHEGLKKNRGAD